MDVDAQMEVSALRYSGGTGLHGRSPLLRLQSDERLITLVRRGNQSAFEMLVSRYHSRLLSFCRHMLGSREDAEDVLQDVLTASYNAILADDRAINVRPWLYRIARNRCLNHLRRNRAVGVDSMDIHFAEHGATTADKVHEREEFRQLVDDIRDLPETQRTALVLREMDALSYEQIAEAMETTVSSVKSLLVRARVSLTEAAEARLLSCDEVREELAEVAEGLRRKNSASVRRHVKNCSRCQVFQGEMRKSSRALAALAPIGPLAFLHKLLFAHAVTHSAGSAGAGAAGAAGASGAGGAGAAGAAGAGAGAAGAAGAGSTGLVTAGVGAVATKAAAGIAAAALVTAGTVAIDHTHHHRSGPSPSTIVSRSLSSGLQSAVGSSSMAGSVGAGPGLSVSLLPAAKAASGKVTHAAVTLAKNTAPTQASNGSSAVKPVVTKSVHTDSTAMTPPVTDVPTVTATDTTGRPTGGGSLGTSGGTVPATTSTVPATTTTPTATITPTDTTSTSTTPTSTSPTGTSTDPSTTTPTTTSPTSTSPTSTSPTTTSPTSTSPTSTSPTGTTTVPTSTAPGDTTTGPVTTPPPGQP